MKITLRKANALQNSINDAIKGINFTTEVNVNEFENSEVTLNNARAELLQNVQRKVDLTNALYQVRGLVKEANGTIVDTLLTQVANVEKNIQIYAELSNRKVRERAEVVVGKLEKIKNRPADARISMYGNSDEVNSGVVTDEDVKNFRKFVADAKKAKQKLQDEILEANVRTEIELSEYVVKTLTAENLL